MEAQARRVADFEHCERAGDFYIMPPSDAEGGMMRLSFLCPCGCGDLCGIRIRSDGVQDGKAWGWNLDREKPTTTPSIAVNGNHWHGYLTDGVFRSC